MITLASITVILIIIGSLLVVFTKSLKAAAVIYGIVSLGSVIQFILMNAYDVAITEASIGVFLSLFVIFLFFRRIDDFGFGKIKSDIKVHVRPIVYMSSILLLVIAAIFIYKTKDQGLNSIDVKNRVSYKMITKSVQSTNTEIKDNKKYENSMANIVTSIVIDYRAFDTFGEILILFSSVTAILLLLKKRDQKNLIKSGLILDTALPITSGIVILFGAYVIIHGHLTPGGGFSGGAIVASGLILLLLVNMLFVKSKTLKIIEGISGSLIIIIALIGLFKDNSMFKNILPSGNLNTLFSGGAMTLIYVLIGIKVFSELLSVGMTFYGNVKCTK